jgi:glucose repression mediator protein
VRTAWERYGKKGKYAEAIAMYKQALKFNPSSSATWYNIGGAYYTNDRFSEALDAFKEALRLDPNNVKAKEGVDASKEMLSKGK